MVAFHGSLCGKFLISPASVVVLAVAETTFRLRFNHAQPNVVICSVTRSHMVST